MKSIFKSSFLLIISACYFQASAQVLSEDSSKSEPFFKAHKFDSKCNAAFEIMPSQVLKSKAGAYFGTSLNWVINHKFVISATYNILTTPAHVQQIVAPDKPDTINLKHQFAGLGFSYIVFSNKIFSFQPELTAGWGGIQYTNNNITYSDNFAEIIPAVYGIYNVTKYFRVGIGLNYRIAAGASLHGINSADIGGVGGIVFMRVGTF
jgi:hypothetical protein